MGLGIFFYIFKIGFGELLCAMSRPIVQHAVVMKQVVIVSEPLPAKRALSLDASLEKLDESSRDIKRRRAIEIVNRPLLLLKSPQVA